jgi:surfactin synthase thioesterase subunit
MTDAVARRQRPSAKLRSSPRWLVRSMPRGGESLTLVCFPYAGGGAGVFRGWSERLPAEVEVVAVQLPGREQRLLEPAFDELEPLVRAIVAQFAAALNRPFALFGHSLGALLAYEVAHALRDEAGEPEYLFVSGFRAPHLPPSRDPIHRLPDPSFIDELRRLGGTPQEVLDHEELMDLLLPPLRADIAICETYAHRPRPRLTCPIAAFGGDSDPDVPAIDLAAWRDHTEGDFTFQLFPGDHFFLQHSGAALLAAMSQRLEPLLAREAQLSAAGRAVR